MTQLELPAPAKLNLFLHIVGRRDDGYHNLQTVFQFVDYADTLIFAPRTDDQLTLTDSTSHISAQQNLRNLTVKNLCPGNGRQLY